jgi:hypothetical protein
VARWQDEELGLYDSEASAASVQRLVILYPATPRNTMSE